MDEKKVLWGAAAPPSISSPELNTRGGAHPVSPFARNAAVASRAAPISPFSRQSSGQEEQQKPALPFAKPGGGPVSAFAKQPLASAAAAPPVFTLPQQLSKAEPASVIDTTPAHSSAIKRPLPPRGATATFENVPQPNRPQTATVAVAAMPQPHLPQFASGDGGSAAESAPSPPHAAPVLPVHRAVARPGSPLARNVVQRSADEEPHVAVPQTQSQQLHQVPRLPHVNQQTVEGYGGPASSLARPSHSTAVSARAQRRENPTAADFEQHTIHPPSSASIILNTGPALPPAPVLILPPAPILDPRRFSVPSPSDPAQVESDLSLPPAPVLNMPPAPILDLRRISVGARKAPPVAELSNVDNESKPAASVPNLYPALADPQAAATGLLPAPILPPAPVLLSPAPILPPAPILSPAPVLHAVLIVGPAPTLSVTSPASQPPAAPPQSSKPRGHHHHQHHPPLPQYLAVPEPSSQQASQQVGQDPPSPASPPRSPFSANPTTPTSPFDTAKRAFASTSGSSSPSASSPTSSFPVPRNNINTLRASLIPGGARSTLPRSPFAPPEPPPKDWPPSSESARGPVSPESPLALLRIGIPAQSPDTPPKSPFARTPEDDAAPRSPFSAGGGGGMGAGGAPYSPLSGLMPYGRRAVEEVVQSPIEAAKIFFAERKDPVPPVMASGAAGAAAGLQRTGSVRGGVGPGGAAFATVRGNLPGAKPTNAAQSIIESRRRAASSASSTGPLTTLRTNLIINPASASSLSRSPQTPTTPATASATTPSSSASQSQSQFPQQQQQSPQSSASATQQSATPPPASSLVARNMTIASLRASMAAVAGERLDVAVTCFPKGSPGLFPPGVAAALDEEEFDDVKYSLLRRAMLQTLGMQADYPLLMPPDLLGLLIEDF
ncbi:hypothetical protein HDU89_001658 [Geranomyces variabilis]|nr:hypothetical protein HDU89_001658 [Geranomyces variabilis]